MRIVRTGTPAAHLSGGKPVVIAKNLERGFYLFERVSDGEHFLEIPSGANVAEAKSWANLVTESNNTEVESSPTAVVVDGVTVAVSRHIDITGGQA
jgi:hypothetical protein